MKSRVRFWVVLPLNRHSQRFMFQILRTIIKSLKSFHNIRKKVELQERNNYVQYTT